MKIRKLKKIKMVLMHHIVIAAYWQKRIDFLFKQMDTPEEKARRDKAFEQMWSQLLKPVDVRTLETPEPNAQHEYRVLRKSTGQLHKTYATLCEAQAAIDRNKRNRQAALVLA